MRLRAENLVKQYKKRRVVNDMSLEVEQGEIVGLLGPNGAGKTTTFYMTVGLVTPDEGEVYLDDEKITGLAMYQRAQKGVGYLPQEASVFRDLSVEDNILAVLELTSKSKEEQIEKTESLISEFGLEKVRKNLGKVLSGGERRRCEIARALAVDPKFILLDEPFAALDILTIKMLQEIIVNLQAIEKITVVVCDHQARDLLSCVDRAIVLSNGKIIASGSPNKIINDTNARSAYFGDEFKIN